MISLLPAATRPADPTRAAAVVAATLSLLAGALLSAPAHAARADRNQPMSIDSDSTKGSIVDLSRHSAVFVGNVVIRQGTLVIQADRLELQEDPDGRKVGIATGTTAHLANFRQQSDRPGEWTEGEAQRIEYDSDANRVRFVGDAHLRVLRDGVVTDEGRAAVISYDTQQETIQFDGKPPVPGSAASAATGRTHVVFSPTQLRGRAASAPAGGAPAPTAASAPAPAPAPASRPGGTP